MPIPLTWDLFIFVFFGINIAYSYIIGRSGTLKIIISSYVAILAANGIGNILERYIVGSQPIAGFIAVNTGAEAMVIFKIAVFVIVTLLLVMRGAFHVTVHEEDSKVMAMLVNLTYGFLSAGLISSTILVYVTGGFFGGIVGPGPATLQVGSPLIQTLINNYSIWFALPAVIFMISSFLNEKVVPSSE